jgi:hypothetical protein
VSDAATVVAAAGGGRGVRQAERREVKRERKYERAALEKCSRSNSLSVLRTPSFRIVDFSYISVFEKSTLAIHELEWLDS